MRAYRYPWVTRLAMFAGAAILPVAAAHTRWKGEAVPGWGWLLLAGLSTLGAWCSWLLRGTIFVSEEGIGFRFRGKDTWIPWRCVERVECGRLWGAIRICGGGRRICFIDQIDGYLRLSNEVASRAPQWSQDGLGIPFSLRASAFSWLVLALLGGGGLALISFAWFGANDPANDWWARPAVAVFGLASVGFGAGRFVPRIDFGQSEIVVRYLIRPTARYDTGQLTGVREATTHHRGARVVGLELQFEGGRKLGIAPWQFDQPISAILEALRKGYRLE